MEKWTTAGVWKGMRPLDTLASDFTLIAYDRRESGHSGGRVEKLSWALFADQAKRLLDHLKIGEAFVLGGCMGCSVALAFAARYPALVLHWPVGGYRWKVNGGDRFARHRRSCASRALPRRLGNKILSATSASSRRAAAPCSTATPRPAPSPRKSWP
jgi:pimeloyl-ACP methyl ester carboxylesterase